MNTSSDFGNILKKFWNLKNLNFAWFFYEITLQVFEFCIFELGLRHSRWSKTSFSFWLILSRIWLSLDIQGRWNLHNFHQKSKKSQNWSTLWSLETPGLLSSKWGFWSKFTFLSFLHFPAKTGDLSIIPDIRIWIWCKHLNNPNYRMFISCSFPPIFVSRACSMFAGIFFGFQIRSRTIRIV